MQSYDYAHRTGVEEISWPRFAELAAEHSGLETAVYVCGKARPEWLKAVLGERRVRECPVDEALKACAG